MNTILKKQITKSAKFFKKKAKMINNITIIFKPIVDRHNQTTVSLDQKNNNLAGNNMKQEKYEYSEILSDQWVKLGNKNEGCNKTLIVASPNDYEDDSNVEKEDDEDDDSSDEHDPSGVSFKTLDSTCSPQRQSTSWSLSSEALGKIPFGIGSERGKLMMGNMQVMRIKILISVVTYLKDTRTNGVFIQKSSKVKAGTR